MNDVSSSTVSFQLIGCDVDVMLLPLVGTAVVCAAHCIGIWMEISDDAKYIARK